MPKPSKYAVPIPLSIRGEARPEPIPLSPSASLEELYRQYGHGGSPVWVVPKPLTEKAKRPSGLEALGEVGKAFWEKARADVRKLREPARWPPSEGEMEGLTEDILDSLGPGMKIAGILKPAAIAKVVGPWLRQVNRAEGLGDSPEKFGSRFFQQLARVLRRSFIETIPELMEVPPAEFRRLTEAKLLDLGGPSGQYSHLFAGDRPAKTVVSKVLLDPEKAKASTPWHEFTHARQFYGDQAVLGRPKERALRLLSKGLGEKRAGLQWTEKEIYTFDPIEVHARRVADQLLQVSAGKKGKKFSSAYEAALDDVLKETFFTELTPGQREAVPNMKYLIESLME